MDGDSLDADSVLHALSTTRSVRRRLDLERPVEPEVIESCIDVATQAPTGLQRESWRFVVVSRNSQSAINALSPLSFAW